MARGNVEKMLQEQEVVRYRIIESKRRTAKPVESCHRISNAFFFLVTEGELQLGRKRNGEIPQPTQSKYNKIKEEEEKEVSKRRSGLEG